VGADVVAAGAGVVAAGAPRAGVGAAAGCAAPSAKVTSGAPTLTVWPGWTWIFSTRPAIDRRRDLDLGLVGLDLEERRVFSDDVALVHEDRDDLGLGQAFSKVREAKGAH
jgi:hypothetical protein